MSLETILSMALTENVKNMVEVMITQVNLLLSTVNDSQDLQLI